MESLPDRVCDYVAVIQYDSRNNKPRTFVRSRFPLEDHPDYPFPKQANTFCYPYGDNYLPTENKIKQHCFVFSQTDGSKIYGACLLFKSDDYKALMITSHWPFLQNLQSFLLNLYQRTVQDKDKMNDQVLLEEYEIPIERVVSNFVYEVPVPPCGKILVKANPLSGLKLVFMRAPVNKLPYLYVNFFPLFEKFSIQKILVILSAILSEKKVLFLSNDISEVIDITETIRSLLKPLFWQHIYLPILPASHIHVLNAPIPYICGLLKRSLPPKTKMVDTLVVDLSECQVKMTNEMDLILIPEYFTKDLIKFFKKKVDFKKDLVFDMNKSRCKKTENLIRDKFMILFTRILNGYNRFFDWISGKRIYSRQNFTKFAKPEAISFYSVFLQTQMFQCFIDSFTRSVEDVNILDTNILYFNEKTKSQVTDSEFINDESYIHDKEYECLLPDKIGLNFISINIQHKRFPDFKQKFIKPPREIESLTSEAERQTDSLNFFKIPNQKYFRKKYISLKHTHIFSNANNRINRNFEAMSKKFLECLKKNVCLKREIQRDSEDVKKTPIKEEKKVGLKKAIKHINQTENALATLRIKLLDQKQKLHSNSIFKIIENGEVINSVISNLSKVKQMGENSKNNLIKAKAEKNKTILNRKKSSEKENLSDIEHANYAIELAKLQLDLICDDYDQQLKQINKRSQSLNKKRMELFVNGIRETCELEKESRLKEVKHLDHLMKELDKFDAEEDLQVFNKSNTKELLENYNEKNLIEIHEKEKKRFGQSDDECFEKLRNLFSFNLWDSRGVNKNIDLIEQSIRDEEERIRIINAVKPIYKTLLDFHSASVQTFEQNSQSFKYDSFMKIGHYLLTYSIKKELNLKTTISMLENNIKLVEAKRNKLLLAIKNVKEKIKIIQREIALRQRKVTLLKENYTKSHLYQERSLDDFILSIKTLEKANYSRVDENIYEMNEYYKHHLQSIKDKTKMKSSLESEKRLLKMDEMKLILTFSSSLDYIQECDKDRYLSVKTIISERYRIANKDVTNSKNAIEQLSVLLEKELSIKKEETAVFDELNEEFAFSNPILKDVLTKFRFEELVEYVDEKLKHHHNTFDSQKKFFTGLIKGFTAVSRMSEAIDVSSFKLTSLNSHNLNEAYINMVEMTLRTFANVKKYTEELQTILKNLVGTFEKYSKAMNNLVNKSRNFIANTELAKSNFEKYSKQKIKVAIKSQGRKNMGTSLSSLAKKLAERKEKTVIRKLQFIEKFIWARNFLVNEFTNNCKKYVKLMEGKVGEELRTIDQNDKCKISRMSDLKLLFERTRSDELPPEIVLEYLQKKNNHKETSFRRVNEIDFSEKMELSNNSFVEVEDKSFNDEHEEISFFDYLFDK